MSRLKALLTVATASRMSKIQSRRISYQSWDSSQKINAYSSGSLSHGTIGYIRKKLEGCKERKVVNCQLLEEGLPMDRLVSAIPSVPVLAIQVCLTSVPFILKFCLSILL